MATNEEIARREDGLCLVSHKKGDDVNEIEHRGSYPKNKQVEAGIFDETNRVLLSRKVHVDLGSPVVGKQMLRYLLYLKYGGKYKRPELTEWEHDTIVKYLMYIYAEWPRPSLKENVK